jgi:hypothetical protein
LKNKLQFPLILVLFALFILPACGDGSAKEPAINSKEYIISDFDGWWYRPDNYISEGISVVDIFKVDAAAGTWTVYNQYGGAGETLSCWVSENGLTLEADAFGDVFFAYDGESLLNDDGGIEFMRGEALEVNTAELDGKWFRSGDPDGDYYIIDGGAYQKFSVYLEEPEETGTWKYNDITHFLTETESVQEKQIDFIPDDDETGWGGSVYIPSKDGIAFYDSLNDVFYVNESAIDTSDGDKTIKEFQLICNDWEGVDFGDPYIDFSFYGTFDVVIFNSEGKGERTTPGTWSFDGEIITLDFYDGTSEEVEYVEDSITVDYYGITFEKDNW